MNLYKYIEARVKSKLKEIKEISNFIETEGSNIVVEVPKNRDFGDFSTNVAMVLAKPMQKNPREIAQIVVEKLKELKEIKNCSIAGPGFINIFVDDSLWDQVLNFVIENKDTYGNSDLGKGEKLNVEFLSANPTGPVHVGHARGALFGDVLSKLMQKNGYDVTKEYYINDYGQQVGVLARSLYWRYEELFALHANDTFPEGCYPGDYLLPIAEKIKNSDGDIWLNVTEDQWLEHFKTVAVDSMMDLIRSNLAEIGITFDVFVSEKHLAESRKVEEAIELMKKKDLVYQGTLPKPQGEDIKDWEPEVQLLFKSTEFGDDIDRVIARANGATTYFASDIAYHLNKFERGFTKQIDVWGADHGGYVKRITSALSAASDNKIELEVKLYQIVNLEKDGKPFRMSKRAGNFILIPDVLEEIDADAFRLFMVMKSSDSQMNFDLGKAKEQSKDNPVFYIQYAHARSNSVLRKYAETFGEKIDDKKFGDFSFYEAATEIEKNLVKTIADYPSIVETAGKSRAPQILTTYLEELARHFHSLWTVGAKEGVRLIDPDNKDLSFKRMILVTALKNTIANGLITLGVTPKESMESNTDIS